MQLRRLRVTNLFGHFDHDIEFPTRKDEDPVDSSLPAVVILHGPNGVGKTTALRMLVGFMELVFDVFREVPFGLATLEFSTGERISARRIETKGRPSIEVEFREHKVRLKGLPGERGGLEPTMAAAVTEFRREFFETTRSLQIDYISTDRRPVRRPDDQHVVDEGWVYTSSGARLHGGARREPDRTLAIRVQQFIQEAQLDYRRFFSTTEPDLFSRLMERVGAKVTDAVDRKDLVARLEAVWAQDEENVRLGIERDRWNLAELRKSLMPGKGKRRPSPEAMTVMGAYTEVLESRAKERQLIADRLLTFERIAQEFLLAKRVRVHPRLGFVIEDVDEAGNRADPPLQLGEDQLSTGEYHLLYLLVSSLVTQRRGTVIAIDEPEMSMHIAWQRRLIAALLELASNATPQFVFATHSPDIVANFGDYLVPLEPREA